MKNNLLSKSNQSAGYFLPVFGAEALKELIKSYQEAGGYVWSRMCEHILELATTYPINLAESGLQQYADIAIQQLGIENTF